MNNAQEPSASGESITEPKNDCVFANPNVCKTIVTDCLSSWVNYLQVLNNLCTAGFKLSQCLGMLAQTHTVPLASQCQASWEELGKATIIASNSVKTHVAAAMQDLVIGETFSEGDAHKQQEHNQHIVTENLLTFINLQYQFSIATCECFVSMAACPCCQISSGGTHEPECSIAALQQCFARLYSQDVRSQTSSPHSGGAGGPGECPRVPSPSQTETRGSSPVHAMGHIENMRGPFPNPGQLHTMKGPFVGGGRGSRSPLHFPLFPLCNQRRWSEAAAGDVSGTDSTEGTMRRWSMPWDCVRAEGGRGATSSKLPVPSDRSRSNTPVDPLSQPAAIISSEGLADAIQLLSSRPPTSRGMFHAPHAAAHADERLSKRHHRGGNWQLPDNAQGNVSGSVTEHYDIFPTNAPITSRKSSSSTDSSSCLSIHSGSRSASGSDGGGGESARSHSHLYSIWSGSDHLPFIRLTESLEPSEDNDVENAPSEKGSMSMFPKPT